MSFRSLIHAVAIGALAVSGVPAYAANCGSGSFDAWLNEFKTEAAAKGISQAAINAVHADAASIKATDWGQILALYDQLLAASPTAVVALNRAIALAEVRGPDAALALVDELDLEDYHLFHAARADLLRRLGRPTDAARAYARAADLAPSRGNIP